MKMHALGPAAVVVALVASSSGHAGAQPTDTAPSSGLGLTIAGSVLTGRGALNLATAPVCKVDALFPERDTQDLCLYSSLIAGGAFIAVGVPLLIVGLGQRSEYQRWERAHPAQASLLSGLRLAVTDHTMALSLHAIF